MPRKEIAAKLPALTPQPHGGALYAGGIPGHIGAGGRPRSVLRQRLRGSFEDRIRVLEEIADDTSADCQDRIRGLDVLAKYGLGTVKEVSVDEVRERVRRTVEVIRNELPENLTTHVINLLRDIWTT